MVFGVVLNARIWFLGGRIEPCMILRRLPWKALPFIAVCVLVTGCAALPEPDGLEAAIIEQAEGLAALTPADGRDSKSIARNGLLLSPSVQESAGLVSASADEVRVQRAALFPGLALTMVGGAGDAGSGDPALELQATQLLFDGGNSQRAVKLADFDLQIDYITFQKTVDDVLIDLLAAYDSVQLQGDLLDIYKNQLAALSELESLVARRVDNGAASSTDLLETRKRLQAAAFLVTDTELALAEARDRLVLLTGQSRGGQVRMRATSCKAIGETDDIRIARLELARAQLALKQAEKARTPGVSLKPIIQGEVGTGRLPAGVDIDIRSDLLQGGALQARVNAAHNALFALEAKLENANLEDNLTQRGLLRALTTAEQKTDMLREQISLLSETRELYRSQYFDLGTRQLSELLDNEEEYYRRQAELAELRSEIALDRLHCAVRSRVLRRELGIENRSIYGFPLSIEAI